jgi:two-component system CheB/CheR fusion protein
MSTRAPLSAAAPEEGPSGRDGARLLAAVQELSQLRDLDGVAAVVRRAARELSGADGVTFALREGDHFYYADEEAIAPLWKGRRFSIDGTIPGLVIRQRCPVVIEDVFADPRVPPDLYRSTVVKSMVVIPIRAADPIGAIGAYWATSHRATDREIGLLQALAGSTSVALVNAELCREARAARVAAEAANRVKVDVLSILSHELRTPLTSILGWARILRGRPHDAAAAARGLEVIERNARAQAEIVDALLDASRIATEGLHVTLEPVSLDGIAEQVILAIRQGAEARHVELSWARPGEPLVIPGDAGRLTQILGNVVSNAIKFTPPGGHVGVACARTPERAEVRVHDTGRGIAPAYLPRVFDCFSQQDTSVTRTHGGLGLGLSVARHLVERHGGEIRVESAGEGYGTTVTLSFPLAPEG